MEMEAFRNMINMLLMKKKRNWKKNQAFTKMKFNPLYQVYQNLSRKNSKKNQNNNKKNKNKVLITLLMIKFKKKMMKMKTKYKTLFLTKLLDNNKNKIQKKKQIYLKMIMMLTKI